MASSTSISMTTATASALENKHQDHIVGLDCEMVGVGRAGTREDALARCTLVASHGVLLDTYVRVSRPITDYRTEISGIEKHHLESSTAVELSQCQKTVQQYIQGAILVGHGVLHDLECLGIEHPISRIRDTSLCPILCPSRSLKLRELANTYLKRSIQNGPHSSIEDATTALDLYHHVREKWELLASQNRHHRSDNYSKHRHRGDSDSDTYYDECRWDDGIDDAWFYQDD